MRRHAAARRYAAALRRFLRGTARSFARLPLRSIVPAVAVLGLALAGYLAYCIATLPLDGGLQIEATPSALVLEAGDGQVFATRGVFKGEKLTAGDLPAHLAQAVVAIEDRRFYQHGGVDPRGMLRAAWRNTLAGGTREGASTITQQLARMMFLSPDRTLRRKVQEALIALWLEHKLTKEEILVRYLNTAYFGAGAYGVDAAAKRYFGKSAKDLSLSEAAMLAGLVRAPSQLAPHRNLDGARDRAALVLDAMTETGAITPAEAEEARRHPATLQLPPEAPPGTNYFVDMVDADVRHLLGPAPADLRLRTTLDLDLQEIAEATVAEKLAAEGRAKHIGQAALVALAPDGAILALVGGRDYEESQFDRAVQARRQPGSLFKLFVYLTALQKGYTPRTTVVDRPVRIGDWEPQNYGGRYRGAVSLRTAFAHSINTVAVQLAQEVGIASVIDTAKRLGIQSDLPTVPSLALGSAEVTLLEMTGAFASVAAGTQPVRPYGVRSIQGRGQTLYTRPPSAPDETAIPAETRAAMLDLLTAVVREGTGKGARLPNLPAAGKTGTTQDYRDAWFIGFTQDLVVGVWVGNDDNSPTNRVTGGDVPAAIWRTFVEGAEAVLAKRRAPAPAEPAAAATTAALSASGDGADVRGSPVVLDSGTLGLDGGVVRLLGIQGESGRAKRALARFLRGREVACTPAGPGGVYRCQVDGGDLSDVILRSGGAEAAPDAPADLLAAQEEARRARRGLWRRRPP